MTNLPRYIGTYTLGMAAGMALAVHFDYGSPELVWMLIIGSAVATAVDQLTQTARTELM